MRTHNPKYARSEYHTQLAKMSFDKIFDLADGVYFFCILYVAYSIQGTGPYRMPGTRECWLAYAPKKRTYLMYSSPNRRCIVVGKASTKRVLRVQCSVCIMCREQKVKRPCYSIGSRYVHRQSEMASEIKDTVVTCRCRDTLCGPSIARGTRAVWVSSQRTLVDDALGALYWLYQGQPGALAKRFGPEELPTVVFGEMFKHIFPLISVGHYVQYGFLTRNGWLAFKCCLMYTYIYFLREGDGSFST